MIVYHLIVITLTSRFICGIKDDLLLNATKEIAAIENDPIEKVATCNSCPKTNVNLTSDNIKTIVNTLLNDSSISISSSTTTTSSPSPVTTCETAMTTKLPQKPLAWLERPHAPYETMALFNVSQQLVAPSTESPTSISTTTISTTRTTMAPGRTTTRIRTTTKRTIFTTTARRRFTKPTMWTPPTGWSLEDEDHNLNITDHVLDSQLVSVTKRTTKKPNLGTTTRKRFTKPTMWTPPTGWSSEDEDNIDHIVVSATKRTTRKPNLGSTTRRRFTKPTMWTPPTGWSSDDEDNIDHNQSVSKRWTLPTTKKPKVTTTAKPEPLNAINTKISLYTRKNPFIGQTLVASEPVTVQLAHQYNSHHPTRFIIHGSFDYSHWMRDMKDKILANQECNVIIVDWSAAASKTYSPIQRLSHSRDVGHQVTCIINAMMKFYHTDPTMIHIIAYGDGTFAADIIGQSISNLGRISGLNPSGPVSFEHLSADQRLDKTDALFVDIIHTDDSTKSISPSKKGTAMAIGDVDFYPNGGILQPGCSLDDLDDLFRKMINDGIRELRSCSPYRAIDYYIETISDSNKCLHMAYECSSYDDFRNGHCGHYCNDETHLCSEVGFRSNLYFNSAIKASRSESIKLFYSTARKRPFCLFHYNVQVNFPSEPAQVRAGVLRMRIAGDLDGMDVKIHGGFKSGFQSGILVTNPHDLGSIHNASVSWIPSSVMALFYSEKLVIENIKVAQIEWQGFLKTERVITLCPILTAGIVKPFYGFLYSIDNCFYRH